MRLSEVLRPDLVLTDLEGSGAEAVIRRLAQHLEDRQIVPTKSAVEKGLLARERAHSTALGHGIALPHTTLPNLDRAVLMVALAEDAVPFGPPGTEPVRVFFVLLSPPGHENEHIKLLARICRLVRDTEFVDELGKARSGEEVVHLIERVDQEHV